ncbi:MAG: hypothetical protein HC896_01120 [Bacteroidales bacterium]|nr:hypothetical protein [Bacteroidales bacterium]
MGKIYTGYFKNYGLDLKLEANNFLMLETIEKDNPGFFGTAYASGTIEITGPVENIQFDILATTRPNTRIFIPLYNDIDVSSYNFVTFVSPNQPDNIGQSDNYKVNLDGIQLNFDLEITPSAEVQLLFDPKVGDIIKGRGNGNIKMGINTLGQFTMFGDLRIASGDYLFTMGNIVNKRFTIEEGGLLSWNGDPLDANIDIKTIYKTKASIENIMGSPEYSKRVSVECQLHLTNTLEKPNLAFGIFLPTVDGRVRASVQNAISGEDALYKNFLSLLVLNSFAVEQNASLEGAEETGNNAFASSGKKPPTRCFLTR